MEKIQINDKVVHNDIYHGNEIFRVVGIRTEPDEVELEGDWSGGTHNVCQRGWYKKEENLIVCPHCNFKSTSILNMNKWHFDNCKYKKDE